MHRLLKVKIVFNIKHFSLTSSYTNLNLMGRHCIIPKSLTSEELKSILWTALELKQVCKNNHFILNYMSQHKYILLMSNPCLEIQGPAMSAANIINTHLNVIIDPQWDSHNYVKDVGKFLGTCFDLIFCQTKYQTKIQKLAEGLSVPVVNVKSCSFTILSVLANLMTIQEKYGYLNNLTLGWVGNPTSVINTYFCIGLRLGINIKYCCACKPGLGMCPSMLPIGKKISKKHNTGLLECDQSKRVLDQAHIIFVAAHSVQDNKLKLKDIEERAEKNWSLLHDLVEPGLEMDEDVFNHKNSLVWESKKNKQWIYAAIMVRLTTEFQHCTVMPNFDKKTLQ